MDFASNMIVLGGDFHYLCLVGVLYFYLMGLFWRMYCGGHSIYKCFILPVFYLDFCLAVGY